MHELLFYAVITLSVLSAVLIVSKWRDLNIPEKYFGYFILLTALFEVIARITVVFGNTSNNLPGLHLYTLIKFVIVTCFFASLLDYLNERKVFYSLLFAGSGLILFNSLFVQSIFEFNSYSKTGVDLYCVLLSILFFISVLKSRLDDKEIKPIIYFVVALFLNASITSILYLFSNEIMDMMDSLRNKLWLIVITVNLITQLIIILGILHIYKKSRQVKS